MAHVDLVPGLLAWLASQSVGVVGQTLWQGEMPADASGVLLRETGGGRSNPLFGYVSSTIQVTARARTLPEARSLAWRVHDLLVVMVPRTYGAAVSLKSEAIQAPFLLGLDERQQWRFVTNIEFWTL